MIRGFFRGVMAVGFVLLWLPAAGLAAVPPFHKRAGKVADWALAWAINLVEDIPS